ncbi:fusaric acid resistance family protein [Volucribacter psittacicida]|uniref:Fusaric acid resistance family protein n=1 Tax=Volucribacter psittacicida TaxID=203482 RepID=A0A4R1FXJ4_9PAST|nr:FUSC family protein [Volucribacter psittacicida]TCJ98429.1 fusaric acid resistance family protein [Volucribacter psittacicida]
MSILSQKYQSFRQLCGTIYWRELILCSPAILLVLAISTDFSYIHAVIMVGAAFSVGFGASRSFYGHRWGALTASAVGMAVAAVAGSLFGHEGLWLYLAIALLSAGCAILTSYNNDLWWITLQIVVAFLVASYYPEDWENALLRGAFTLLGAGLQLVGMMLSAKLFPYSATLLPPVALSALSFNKQIRFVIAVILAVNFSLYIAKSAGLANDYWAAMTALIILRPDSKTTLERAINRFIGTLLGCCFATLAIYGLQDNALMLLSLLALTSGAAFSMQKAHYALLTSMISATIVLLIGLGSGDPVAITEHRIIATLLGGGVTLIICRLLRV